MISLKTNQKFFVFVIKPYMNIYEPALMSISMSCLLQLLGFVSTRSQSPRCDHCACFMTCRLETKVCWLRWMRRLKLSWMSGRPRRRLRMGYNSSAITGYESDQCAWICCLRNLIMHLAMFEISESAFLRFVNRFK